MKSTTLDKIQTNGNGRAIPAPDRVAVSIAAPNFKTATFTIKGNAPLVIHRFSAKTKLQMKEKMEAGKSAGSKKVRAAKSTDDTFQEARYVSKKGWDGFHAAAIRNAMISACRLVGFKMTLAKMSVFVIADGVDAQEPQIPLVRIYGEPVKQEDMARVDTGQPYVTVRAAYHDWSAKINIRWDADQFSAKDVANLLTRVGMQVGIGEGRPDSKKSAGMGWGTFDLVNDEN
jgi:hypothetical protein